LRFRPRLLPTLIAVPAVLVLVALGTWQLERLEWKTNLIATRTARTAAPAIELPLPGEPVGDVAFYRSSATGLFLHDREMRLGPRTFRGAPGYQIITPMRLARGGFLLVNRGWVPFERADPQTRPQGQLSGTVTIEGVLREPGRQGLFTPDNKPDQNVWLWADLAGMAAAAHLDGPVVPVFLEAAGAPTPGGLPIGLRSICPTITCNMRSPGTRWRLR
jgi:surfeit locus 1 family protein